PPRVVADFICSPLPVPFPYKLVAYTWRMPPEVSLPSVNKPPPLRAIQLRITMYSVGLFTRKPSQSRPAFKQKSSSLQSMSQFSISTQVEESTSTPSVLG